MKEENTTTNEPAMSTQSKTKQKKPEEPELPLLLPPYTSWIWPLKKVTVKKWRAQDICRGPHHQAWSVHAGHQFWQ